MIGPPIRKLKPALRAVNVARQNCIKTFPVGLFETYFFLPTKKIISDKAIIQVGTQKATK